MAVDKIVDGTALDNNLTSVANAIRTKGGTSGSLSFPSGFVSAINAISGGGQEELELVASNITIDATAYPTTPTSITMSSAHQTGDNYVAEILTIADVPMADAAAVYSSSSNSAANSAGAGVSASRRGVANAYFTMTNGSNVASVQVSGGDGEIIRSTYFTMNLYRLR